MCLMLKIVNKFKYLFIVNLNLFVIAFLNDFKSHVNIFIILNNVMSLIECNF
jgi:hypothetical protein